MPPAWLTDLFAALMLLVAAVSAARLTVARPWRQGAVITDTDTSYLLTGIAMAGMLASSLSTLSNTAWAVVFAVLTAWFAYRVVRDARAAGVRALAGGHCAPHLVHSAAMLYMFLAITTSGGSGMAGMAGMGGSGSGPVQALRYPTLAFVFAIILIGYTAWDLDQLPGFGPALALAVPASAEPALAGATAGSGNAAAGAAIPDRPAGQAPARGRSAVTGFLLSSEITVGCRIAMGVTMALILFLMI